MNLEELPGRITRFSTRLMGVKKRPNPRTSPTPVFANFQDRLFASCIDMGIIFFIFADLFEWIRGQVYQGMDDRMFQSLPPELQNSTPQEQIRYFVDQLFASGFVELWILNSFFQSLIVGALLIAVWFQYNTTPGKFILGLKFAGENGEGKPDLKTYIKRYAAFYLSMPVIMLGFVWLVFDKQKRAWHDRMAGTTVIYTKEGSILRRVWDMLIKLVKRWMQK